MATPYPYARCIFCGELSPLLRTENNERSGIMDWTYSCDSCLGAFAISWLQLPQPQGTPPRRIMEEDA